MNFIFIFFNSVRGPSITKTRGKTLFVTTRICRSGSSDEADIIRVVSTISITSVATSKYNTMCFGCGQICKQSTVW